MDAKVIRDKIPGKMTDKLDAHLFICTNERQKGECCAAKGAPRLREALKKLVKEKHPDWKGRVRVNASGCLGHCETGITAVLYPGGKWYHQLDEGCVALLERELAEALAKVDGEAR